MKPRTIGGHYVHCDVVNPDDVTRLYGTAVDAFGTVDIAFDNAGISPAQDGSIVNVASFVALMGSATSQSSYTASKGAVLALTRELGVEFARKGIRINSVCPGPVNTRCCGNCSPPIPRHCESPGGPASSPPRQPVQR